MIRTTTILAFLMILVFSGASSHAQDQNAKRPNIIIILADDLGYGDLGLYGGKTPVPNIAQLAKEGMRFNDFHSNGAVCSPTRASLLTGRYQQRMGIETPLSETEPGMEDQKASGEITIAKYLHDAGYFTGIIGKWHLGYKANPTEFGFDEFWGELHGSSDYISKVTVTGEYDWWHNKERVPAKGYNTSLLTQHALQFLDEHKQEPFFLYLAHNAIHFPWQTPNDSAARKVGSQYKDVSGPLNKLGPHKPEEVSDVISVMIKELDKSVGEVMKKLRELKLDENTIVFFLSDNGGIATYKGGYSWISSNSPYRGEKGNVYEGGHRVPAIAWWPKKIKAGQTTNQTAMTMDIAPTIMELTGIKIPDNKSKNKIDGRSILDFLVNNKTLSPKKLFWRHRNGYAVRWNDWKLVKYDDKETELYDLNKDPGETRNLAASNQQLVRELMADLETWKKDVYNTK